MTCGTANT